MGILQKRSDKVYTYLKAIISVLATIPGMNVAKFGGIGLDLLYKNLYWNGIFNGDITSEQKAQLENAIKTAFKSSYDLLPQNKREILARAYPIIENRLEYALSASHMNISYMEEICNDVLHNPSVLESEWLTSRDIDNLAALFLAQLWIEIKKQKDLANVVSLDNIREIANSLKDIYPHIKQLEDNIDDLKKQVDMLTSKSDDANIDFSINFLLSTIYPPTKKIVVITHGPSVISNYYIGREEIESYLREGVRNTERQLLSGMGGIGKTQICSNMFHQYLCNSDWINDIDSIGYLYYTDNEDDMVYNSILFDKSGVWSADVKKAWQILEAVSIQRRLLLFIDDVRPTTTGKDTVIKFVRLNSLHCPIILASRDATVTNFKKIPLDFLPKEVCFQLFQNVYGKKVVSHTDKQILEDIIDEYIAKHTLTLNLVASSAREFGWSMSELKRNLSEQIFHIEMGNTEDSIQIELQKLYGISQLNQSEISILEAFSILPATPLDFETCAKWLSEDAKLDRNFFHKCIHRLFTKGWLQQDTDGYIERYSMHAVIASAIKGQKICEFKDHVQLVLGCNETIKVKKGEVFTKVLPFLAHAENITQSFKITSIEIAYLCHSLGILHYLNGSYIQALRLYKEAVFIYEDIYGMENIKAADIYDDIANIYFKCENYSEALNWYREAFFVRKKRLGRENLHTAISYINIASVYAKQGKIEMALDWYKNGEKASENTIYENHIDLSSSYYNISEFYLTIGNYDEAFNIYQKTLDLCQNTLGEQHPDTATSFYNIAEMLFVQCQYLKAIEYHQKSLDIRKNVLGENHPDTMASYLGLAKSYDILCLDYTNVMELYNRVLSNLKCLVKEFPTATIYNNIAYVYLKKQEFEKALDFYNKALATYKEGLQKDSPSIARSYRDIAWTYYYTGNYYDGIISTNYYRDALSEATYSLNLFEKAFGKKHYETTQSYYLIGLLHLRDRCFDKALKCFQEILMTRQNILGEQHPLTISIYHDIAEVFYNQKDYITCLEWYNKYLSITEVIFGKCHPWISSIYKDIAWVYYSEANFPLALEWFEKALLIYKKISSENHPCIIDIYKGIANTYEMLNEYNLSIKWHHKTMDIAMNISSKYLPDKWTRCKKIASIYIKINDYYNALSYSKMSWQTQGIILGVEYPDLNTIYKKIADYYEEKGDFYKALIWNQKDWSLHKNAYDENYYLYPMSTYLSTYSCFKEYSHNISYLIVLQLCESFVADYVNKYNSSNFRYPVIYTYEIAMTCKTIAEKCSSCDDYTLALYWYNKAVYILSNGRMINHYESAKFCYKIADAYNDLSCESESAWWYEKTFYFCKAMMDAEQSYIASIYCNEATPYGSEDDPLSWYMMALLVYEKVLGGKHSDSIPIYCKIAGIYSAMSDYPAALKWCQKALLIFESTFSKDYTQMATIFSNMAVAYYGESNYTKALESYYKAIHEKNTDNINDFIRLNIAEIHRVRGDFNNAIKNYPLTIYQIKYYDLKGNERMANEYIKIANLYNESNDIYTAIKWFQEATCIFFAYRFPVLYDFEIFYNTNFYYEHKIENNHVVEAYINIALAYKRFHKYSESLKWLCWAFYMNFYYCEHRCYDDYHMFFDHVHTKEESPDNFIEIYSQIFDRFEKRLGSDNMYIVTAKYIIQEINAIPSIDNEIIISSINTKPFKIPAFTFRSKWSPPVFTTNSLQKDLKQKLKNILDS